MLNAENSTLIIVDVQRKLLDLMSGKEAFLANLIRLIEGAKVLTIPILYTEQMPEKLGSTSEQLASLLTGISPLS